MSDIHSYVCTFVFRIWTTNGGYRRSRSRCSTHFASRSQPATVGLPIEEAMEVLVADERFTEADAEYALDVLQDRGYIYYVGDRVRITPDDEQ